MNLVALAKVALEQAQGQRVLHLALDNALQGPGAERRIVPLFGQQLLRRAGQLDLHVPFRQQTLQIPYLDLDNLLQMFLRQRVKDDDLVDAVQELGPELLPQGGHHQLPALLVGLYLAAIHELRPHVRRHDDHRVLEIYRPAVPVGQPAFIQQLQQRVKHLGVGLFDLVEQHHAVRPPPHRLGQLAALFVADIARRGAQQPRHGVPLLVFAHVDADHGRFVVKQKLGQRPRQLRLAHTRRSQKDETADGPVGILQSGPAAAHRVRYHRDGLILAHHAQVQPVLHLDQLLDLAFQQLADRNPGPGRDDLGDIFAVDLFLEQLLAILHRFELRFLLGQLLFQAIQRPILQLRGPAIVVLALGFLDLVADGLDLLLRLAQALDGRLFLLPARCQRPALLLQVGQLLLQLLEPLLAGLVLLLLQRLALDLQLHDLAVHPIQLLWLGIDLHPQPAGRLVDEVDGLVRQEPVADVAVGHGRGGDHRRVLDPDAVVDLIPFLQTAQDADRFFNRRLVDQYRLEAALQRRVFFDVLPVFVQRRRADTVQFAAGQHRFEHVAGIHGPLRRSGADHRMQLVDKHHDLALGIGDLFEGRLQALLELAAELGPGDHRPQVELHQPLVLEPLGHVAPEDALGQAFDDGRLARARLADQYRVILGPAAEHLDHAPDLFVAADHRVQLAAPGQVGQITTVLFQGLVGALRRLRGDPLAAANGRQCPQDGVFAQAQPLQQPRHVSSAVFGQRQQQVLGRNKVVAHLPGDLGRAVQGTLQLAGQAGLRRPAVNLGLAIQRLFHLLGHHAWLQAQSLDDRRYDALRLAQQRQQQVLALDLPVAVFPGDALRLEQGFLCFFRISIQIHSQ